MRKDMNDFSDSSSLILMANKKETRKVLETHKSQLEISIDLLLGELSEIKAENGISSEVEATREDQRSEVFFNVLEGHSSVHGTEEEDIAESEIAFDNTDLIGEEDVAAMVDESNAVLSEIEASSVNQSSILEEIKETQLLPAISQTQTQTQENEEEAQRRKHHLFSMALMSLTPSHLSFSLKTSFKQAKNEAAVTDAARPFGTAFDLNTLG